MTARFVVGFLCISAVSGLSLQKGTNLAADGNRSKTESSNVYCDCCWRECDSQHGEHQEIETGQGDADADLPHLPARPEVDAWIIVMAPELAHRLDFNTYTPITETVKVAVESMGGQAEVIGTNVRVLQVMIDSVQAAAANGKRPLVFSVAHEWWGDRHIDVPISTLKAAKDAGGYLVAYQAEPGFDVNGSAVGDRQNYTLDLATRMGAHEVWEYTVANANHYPNYPGRPIVRYVPPGYTPKFDVGVDINSKKVQAGTIGYIGKNFHTTMDGRYVDMFGDKFIKTNSIWSTDDLRTWLETHPLQLNEHRWQTCCPRAKWEYDIQHFETFRMTALLSNKACVISGPSARHDMDLWKSMVEFPEVEDTLATFKRLSNNLQACRLKSYETYKREYEPKKILERSGFFKVWRPPHGK